MWTYILRTFACLLLFLAIVSSSTAAFAALLIDCDQGQVSGDGITRGFYIANYPGSTLDAVDLYFSSSVAGTRTFELTVRLGTYDGAVIGTAQATVDLVADYNIPTETRFTFPSPEIVSGSTITFEMSLVAGPGPLVYAVNPTSGTCPVTQTSGTSPPLDTFRRDGIRIRVLGGRVTAASEGTWSTLKGLYQ